MYLIYPVFVYTWDARDKQLKVTRESIFKTLKSNGLECKK